MQKGAAHNVSSNFSALVHVAFAQGGENRAASLLLLAGSQSPTLKARSLKERPSPHAVDHPSTATQ